MKVSMQLLPLVLSSVVVLCASLSSHFHKLKAAYKPSLSTGSDDPGNPLFLTPYIKSGDLTQARLLSMSKDLGQTSYSGFFTVDEQYNSNMYFIFFPAQNGNHSAPLLLWLQGGPGGSSLFGLFNEQGPILVDDFGMPHFRDVTWNSIYHLLYIDNPVGTGYSFSDQGGLSTTEYEVAENLYSCLSQFFTVFSDYQNNDFYITGESYAGKYIPAIGYKIHTSNINNPAIKIKMQGLAIGDGLCDPENMMGALPDLAYNFGLVDEIQRNFIESQIQSLVKSIQNKDFMKAFEVFDILLNGDIYPYPTYFFNVTGSSNYFNILHQEDPPEFNNYLNYINQPSIRKAMKVGNLSYGLQSEAVEKALILDIMDTVRAWLAVLMDEYKVVLYNGQLDLIVGVPLTEKFLNVLPWSGSKDYLTADREVWKIGDDVAGYIRSVGKFSQVVIRGGGHLVPHDQPERSFNLIKQFVDGKINAQF